MHFPLRNTPQTKSRLHLAIGSLIFVTLIFIIARIADKGTPKARTNTWGIAVVIRSAVFMAYQMVTAHVSRLKKWASLKANMILNMIDTVFWFALFIISILGASASRSTASKALGAIVVLLAIVLCILAGCLSWLLFQDRRHFKAYGCLPGDTTDKPQFQTRENSAEV